MLQHDAYRSRRARLSMRQPVTSGTAGTGLLQVAGLLSQDDCFNTPEIHTKLLIKYSVVYILPQR